MLVNNNNNRFQIESRIKKVLLIVRTAAEVAFSNFVTAITPARFELQKQTANGYQPVIPRLPVLQLMEIANSKVGFGDLVHTSGASGSSLRATIEVVGYGDEGAIQLQDKEFFEATISGLPDGYSVDFYAMDSAEDAVTQIDYKVHQVNANTPRTIDVSQAQIVYLPKTGLQRLEIVEQGRTINLLPEELQRVCEEQNPVSHITNGNVVAGTNTGYCLDVSAADKVTANYDQETQIVLTQVFAL